MARAIVLVLDSFGIGSSSDAHCFGDQGANTYLHIKQACEIGRCENGRTGTLHIPNLVSLGLDKACNISTHFLTHGDESAKAGASWGYAQELSTGKDTSSGHWEMMGQPVLFDWGYFSAKTNSFPKELLNTLIAKGMLPGILGNCHSSGTEIIQTLGEEHLATGKPICYTSADSVFQIACHEAVYTQEALVELCEIAREILTPYKIARVIARPFCGNAADGFVRTNGRRDFSMKPPGETLLDVMVKTAGTVTSIGKISDIFANQGISEQINAYGLDELMTKTINTIINSQVNSPDDNHFIFTNLVDFDTLYGHRRDPNGYALALENFDKQLGELLKVLTCNDLLIITADHGCDPTWEGTDHTREHVPILAYSENIKPRCIGKRSSFADIGQSLASFFNLPALAYGESFLPAPGIQSHL